MCNLRSSRNGIAESEYEVIGESTELYSTLCYKAGIKQWVTLDKPGAAAVSGSGSSNGSSGSSK